ncbi:2-succinyl-5-enolpyruvyl-6-hydroxy-3-cyclohexene-1-carboxylic-acid synthase [Sulfuriroseicoccus oceanibius]|uniref:2-succinyl-5-enolpyruvyl-6-hydroxy-3-cyclohexene-1-carboxylate synthase n=1 Tax=Sulfuriroseicoccus oceanibius TaxID=2707525 RepID=A0A6B3L9B7_9BACT|nr:2-succinyl-5-enolpyruvyl-6-hydroxy-3-cyclohexene-1-carboxylic-acid synthase [Sulfuriroseicoccus oceanibius]QQL46101.1 2-succinyl-5-enolpyruvyl-6-hydroxy-3-cyclohexene-1-carboxylic-acid synthase [Sulfuriroseicoccus oceanibius]
MDNGNLERAAMVMDWLGNVAGVSEVVVCAGARNTPLLVAAEQNDALTCWRHFDERSAGFFALGRAQSSGDPVAVVVTSGTAVAELMPAVVEAHYSGVPLVVVAGDRPADWRGGGAPQSIEHSGIFGTYAIEADLIGGGEADFERLVGLRERWTGRGAAFVNVCFSEPLLAGELTLPDELSFEDGDEPLEDVDFGWCDALLDEIDESRVCVVVGDVDEGDRRDVAAGLAKLGLPVWAEVTSGMQAEPVLHELLIGDLVGVLSQPALCPQRVVRVGGVPNGRFWRDLEDRADIAVTCVSPTGLRGLGRTAGVTAAAGDVMAFVGYWGDRGPKVVDHDWLKRMYQVGAVLRERVAELVANFPQSEVALVAGALDQMRSADAVYLGNSLSIREAQLVCDGELSGGVFANRGANGIDGQLSSFFGCGIGRDEAWGLFGDLTTLYDFSAPWMLDQLAARSEGTRWRVVVINNGGGQIFSRLPALASMSDRARELLVNDSSNVDFAQWADLWGMRHLLVADVAGWDGQALEDAWPMLVELKPDSAQSDAFWDAYRKVSVDVHEAVAGAE